MRRRPLDWMCRMTLSWADKKEVCETWSPSRISCCDQDEKSKDVIAGSWRRASRKQEELAHKSIFYSHTQWQDRAWSVHLAAQTFKGPAWASKAWFRLDVWACLICRSARDGVSVNTKTCHHAASWTWYQSHSAYLWDYELCHLNMTLADTMEQAVALWAACLRKQGALQQLWDTEIIYY